jgi:hypothetical protein
MGIKRLYFVFDELYFVFDELMEKEYIGKNNSMKYIKKKNQINVSEPNRLVWFAD